MKPETNGRNDAPLDSSQQRLTELMDEYHSSLISGAPFAAVDATQLDAEERAAFSRAQRVLERLARVQNQFAHDSQAPIAANPDGKSAVEPTEVAPSTTSAVSGIPKTFGRFEIVSELGHGGLGVVFLARDPLLGRFIALKIPRPDALLTRDLRQRFTREAQAAARLTHPNLAAVYEVGEVGPICYIASAYCEGPDLAAWLRDGSQRPTSKQAAWIVAALADAMHYAHEQGVLHRDLKPSNVLLEPRPAVGSAGDLPSWILPFTPKITDFGLAKIVDFSGDDTRMGSMLGTPAYMAPEQAEGRIDEIDRRTDVYGLGAILYELLSGRAPFVGKSDADTVRLVITEDARFSRGKERDIPADLIAICRKCLEKQSGRRYTNCGELAADLRRFLTGAPTRARPLSRAQRLAKWSRRYPTTAALIVVSWLAAMTIVGGSGLFSWRLAGALHDSEVRREEAIAARGEAEQHRNEAINERNSNAEFLYSARMRQGYQALDQGDIGQAKRLLDEYGDSEPWARLRNFEWHYLKRSLHGERLALTGHKGEVYGVAFSADGRTLASAGADGLIKLWDPASGAELRTIAAHTSCANDVSFSPDGRLLASASCDRTVKLWDTGAWREVASFSPGPSCVMTGVAFSPDGRLLAGGDNDSGMITIWDVAKGTSVATLQGIGSEEVARKGIKALAWSPDGRMLAGAGVFGGTRLWETADWQVARDLPRSTVVAFSPDSTLIATQNEFDDFQVWNVSSGKLHSTIVGQVGSAQKIAFGADARELYTSGSYGGIKILSLTEDAQQATEVSPRGGITSTERVLLGHSERVQSFAIAPGGKTFASASFDGTVRLWNLAATGGSVPVLQCSAIATALSPNLDRLTVVSADRRLVTWDVTSGKVIEDRSIPELRPDERLSLSPNGKYLSAWSSSSSNFRLYAQGSWQEPRQFNTRAQRILSIDYSSDNRYVSSLGYDGLVQIWDVQTQEERFAHKAPFSSNDTNPLGAGGPVAMSPDGAHLLIGTALFDIATRQSVALRFPTASDSLQSVAFSLNNKLLAVSSYDGHVFLVDRETGTTLQAIRNPRGGAIAFSPDSRTLATGENEGRVALWNVATGQELTKLSTKRGILARLQFSADGRSLAAVLLGERSDAALYVWSSD